MLLTDTDILQRICLGKAMRHVEQLRRRGVRLGTTAHNAFELSNNLLRLGRPERLVEEQVAVALLPFELFSPDEYRHLEHAADARLGRGGKSDWPLLAAALALGADIWSEDKAFFGTGVAVWATPNLRFVEQD